MLHSKFTSFANTDSYFLAYSFRFRPCRSTYWPTRVFASCAKPAKQERNQTQGLQSKSLTNALSNPISVRRKLSSPASPPSFQPAALLSSPAKSESLPEPSRACTPGWLSITCKGNFKATLLRPRVNILSSLQPSNFFCFVSFHCVSWANIPISISIFYFCKALSKWAEPAHRSHIPSAKNVGPQNERKIRKAQIGFTTALCHVII